MRRTRETILHATLSVYGIIRREYLKVEEDSHGIRMLWQFELVGCRTWTQAIKDKILHKNKIILFNKIK